MENVKNKKENLEIETTILVIEGKLDILTCLMTDNSPSSHFNTEIASRIFKIEGELDRLKE